MRPVLLCTLASAVVLACGGDDLLLPGDAAPTRIAIAGGDGQRGAVGSTLAESIAVLVSDATGRPVMGQPIAFVVTAGEGASLTPDTVMTGADGRASARWVLGRDAGTQRAQAELVTTGIDAAPAVVFSAAASPGSAAVLVQVSGDNQSAPAGTLLPDSLVVRVEDQFGNPVAGTQVSWTASGGGSVTPTRVTTSTNGRAAARRLLGSQTGEQGTAASASGLSGSPVAFTHSAISSGGGGGGNQGAVSIVSGDDQTGAPGAELAEPLVVRVTDGAGRGVSGASVFWVITDGGGSVQPAFTVTDGGGRASTRWTLGPDNGRNRVNAVVSGIGNAEFEAQARRSGGDDDDDDDDRVVRLSFLVQPSDAEEDERLEPPVKVAAVNAGGSPVTTATGEVEVRLGSGDDDAQLEGKRKRPLEDGVATFSDLKVEREGGIFTLIASAGGLPDAESAPFRIDD